MIVDVIGTKFSVDCEPQQINKIVFAHVRAFMEQNEYFHEEHFLEFVEEDDGFEVVDAMSPAAAIVTLGQLEDWVEEAAVAEDEDSDPLTEDPIIDDPDPENDDDAYGDDDDGDDEDEE